VLSVAPRSVDVVGELGFHMNQPATTGAINPVIQRG
jgi:hypothetical protein